MSAPKLVIYGAGGGLASLGRAFGMLQEEAPGCMEIMARSGQDLFDRKQVKNFIKEAAEADLLMVILHGGKSSCPFFDELMGAVNAPLVYVHPGDEEETALAKQHTRGMDHDIYSRTVLYLKHGGRENWFNLLKSFLPLLGVPSLEFDPPHPQPCQALYHPSLGVFENPDEYWAARGYGDEDLANEKRPIIGLWFAQYVYLEENTEPIDAIFKEVESQGCLCVPILWRRYNDPLLDVKDTKWVVENYCRHKGRPLVNAVISTMSFSLSLLCPGEQEYLRDLDVPILQAPMLMVTYEFWRETVEAVTPMDVSMSVCASETDGHLISVPSATRQVAEADPMTGARLFRYEPLPKRISKLVRLTKNWARLRIKSNHEKKVAIIFHNYPPRNDRIGCAAGLDSFASVALLVDRLKEEGYRVERTWDDPQELAREMVGALSVDQRWLTPDAMAERAAGLAGPELHKDWLRELPKANSDNMDKDWGSSPGELFVHENQVMINGVVNGNVYIGIQPPRGFIEQPEKIHDPYMTPSWHYLYYYRWIRDAFKADAVMHIGKHGSLEWLPGKSVCLSGTCYPDLAIMELPNIYPYIVNDPGEGTQAKRRSYCALIDHLIPVMTNADVYEELAEVDNRITDYLQIKDLNPQRLKVAAEEIWEAVARANLDKDLETDREEAFQDFDAFLEKLHSYLSECQDSAISDGLHIMGQVPEGERLVELATQMLRVRMGATPSLREAMAHEMGYDLDQVLANRGSRDPNGKYLTYGKALEAIHQHCLDAVGSVCREEAHHYEDSVAEALKFLAEILLPNIEGCRGEIDQAVSCLSGGYAPPGPTGSPTRGQVDCLPTGRNFFTLDPFKMPTPAAWRVGVSLGDDLVQKHREKTGEYPDNVGQLIWATSNMRTQGEEMAQALYLMGLKPVWNRTSGRVEGLEVIPLNELKFPRVDITFRTTGLFRDALPNLMQLLDKAVRMVSALKEPPESNFLRRNVIREVGELEKQGMSPEEALEEASLRVFSDPPGTYGAGVAAAIDAKAWEKADDLGEVWVTWAGYAYNKNHYGAKKPETLKRRLKHIKALFKSDDSREYDILGSDDYNAYFGGFVNAVRMVSGIQPLAYIGDASDPDRVKNRTIQEEAKHIYRSRILNPKWMKGLMRHGYKGAGDLSRTVDNSFHWDATTGVIDDWMYQGLAEKYAFDPEIQEWFKEVNPHALHNIAERLLEAINRGMWNADPETKKKLEEVYLEMEGEVEETTV